MIPATWQTPAAVILIAGGLLACFAGYRVFRIVLAIYGFILGAVLASALMPAEQTLSMIVTWLVGGLIGAVVLLLAYFAGVALIGAAVGAALAHFGAGALGTEPGLIVVVLLSIAGALVALVLQRHVIILATAFGGAHTAVVGAAALLGDADAVRAAGGSLYRIYPVDPVTGTFGDVWITVVLGILGAIVQITVTGRERPQRR
jgi:hypothetical protein